MFATCEPCTLHPIQGCLKLAEVLTPQNDAAQGLQHIRILNFFNLRRNVTGYRAELLHQQGHKRFLNTADFAVIPAFFPAFILVLLNMEIGYSRGHSLKPLIISLGEGNTDFLLQFTSTAGGWS